MHNSCAVGRNPKCPVNTHLRKTHAPHMRTNKSRTLKRHMTYAAHGMCRTCAAHAMPMCRACRSARVAPASAAGTPRRPAAPPLRTRVGGGAAARAPPHHKIHKRAGGLECTSADAPRPLARILCLESAGRGRVFQQCASAALGFEVAVRPARRRRALRPHGAAPLLAAGQLAR